MLSKMIDIEVPETVSAYTHNEDGVGVIKMNLNYFSNFNYAGPHFVDVDEEMGYIASYFVSINLQWIKLLLLYVPKYIF